MNVIGFDICGTNTTITVAGYNNNRVRIFSSYKFKTRKNYRDEIEAARNFIENGIKN